MAEPVKTIPPKAIGASSTSDVGNASMPARADHTHALDPALVAALQGVPTTQTITQIVDVQVGSINFPVKTVNGKTGNVVLGAEDVGADPAGTSAAAVAAHVAAVDPHTQYVKKAGDTMTGTLAFSGGVVDLDDNLTPAWKEGRMFYDAQEHALAYYNDAANVTIQVGQELVVRCTNVTGSTIPNGALVYINGAQGSRPTITLASNANAATAHNLLGMVTDDILDNGTGYVCVAGLVNGLNTDGYTEGAKIWLSTGGGFTATEPVAPTHKVAVGYIIRAHLTQGRILIHIESNGDLVDLDDVYAPSKTDGDVLVWNASNSRWQVSGSLANLAAVYAALREPTGFENPDLIDVAYDSTARTITLTQSGGIAYWYRGTRYVLTSPWTSAAHTATAGGWFLAFSTGGAMAWSMTPWSFELHGPVAYVNYDTPTGITFALREVHGLMQWQSHQELHETIGTYRRSGGTLTGGTYAIQPVTPADADNTPGFDSAVVADEDCPSTIATLTQGSYTQLRIAAGSTIAVRTAQSFLVQNGTTYPLVNNPATGAETETVTGRYLNVYQILVPVTSEAGSQAYRMLFLQPQVAYSTLLEAQEEQFASLSLGGLSSLAPEYVAYSKITLRTNAAYTGATGRVRIEAVAYLTGTRNGSTTGATGIWEPYLGLPAVDGYVLSSTTAGVRSWIAPGSGGGISDAPNDGNLYVRKSLAWANLANESVTVANLRIEGTAPLLVVYGSARTAGSRRWQFTTVAGDYFSLQSTQDDGTSPVDVAYINNAGNLTIAGTFVANGTLLCLTDNITRSAAGNALLSGQRCEGTIASPSAISGAAILSDIGGGGYDGTTWRAFRAGMRVRSPNAWTGSEYSATVDFYTTNATTSIQSARIEKDGKWAFYESTDSSSTTSGSVTFAGGIGVAGSVFANYIESSNIFKSTAGSSSSLSDGNFAQPQLELFTFAFGGNYNFQAHGTCCSMYSTVTKTLNITNVSLITGSLRGTKTMPANHLTVGQKYRMKATGTYTAAGTLPNTTLKMRLGGLDLATTGTFQFTASTTGVWEYACEVTVESLSGTSCVVRAHPAMWFQASTATARVDRYSSLNTTVTVNPQNSLVWDLVATIANVAGLTLNTHSFILEQVQ